MPSGVQRMTDDLHPLTNIAKIRRGETALVRQESLRGEVSSLVQQAHEISQINVNRNRIATWWDRGRVEQNVNILAEKVAAARHLSELHEIELKHRRSEILADVQAEFERVMLENQIAVAQEATRLGMLPQDYSTYMLEQYRAQIAIQRERLEYEETFKLAITQASAVFSYQQALIKQIAELEGQLERVPLDYKSEASRRAATRELTALIESKQREHRASQDESFLQTNGEATRRLKTYNP
jgi:hypothetical protein